MRISVNFEMMGGVKKRSRITIKDEVYDAVIAGKIEPSAVLPPLHRALLAIVEKDPRINPFSLDGLIVKPSKHSTPAIRATCNTLLAIGIQPSICIAMYGVAVGRTTTITPTKVDISFQKYFLEQSGDIPTYRMPAIESMLPRLAVPSYPTDWALVEFFALHYLVTRKKMPEFELRPEWMASEALGFSLALALKEDGTERIFFGKHYEEAKKMVSDFIANDLQADHPTPVLALMIRNNLKKLILVS